ncbi:radical SAM protein [Candidatus Woesearchaeota archaeon]|nr:radical SAM protein [Candidatus Woesearchaeota archaeon]
MQNKFGILRINLDCSNNCIFCQIKKKHEIMDIKDNEISLLKEIRYYHNKGTVSVDVTGHSPLEYPKIIGLLKYVKSKFKKATLLDPGNKLANKEFCKKIIETGIDELVLPIYGSKEKYHNDCTGNVNAFLDINKALTNLLEIKQEINSQTPQIKLTTLILRQNIDNIPELIKYTQEKYGLGIYKITIPFRYEKDKYTNIDDYSITPTEIVETIKKVNKITKNIITCFWLPPCLFTEEELLELNNIEFLNFQVEYDVAKIKENDNYEKIAKSYLKLKQFEKCNECILYITKKCQGGIQHLDCTNVNINPIKNKKILEKIKF